MIVVTGGIACGKSTFMEIAKKLGYNCACADEWFHTFRRCPVEKQKAKELFGEEFAECGWFGDVAFVHPNWKEYEDFIDFSFKLWIDQEIMYHNRAIDIIGIPDYFNRAIKSGFVGTEVLTIERDSNLSCAFERDTHRNMELTSLIHQHQMTSEERIKLADYHIWNTGSKEQFEKECESWLKSHLQGRLTHHTKDTNM